MKGYFAFCNAVDSQAFVFLLKWGQWALQTIVFTVTGHRNTIAIVHSRAILY